jgi:hypothetical protein
MNFTVNPTNLSDAYGVMNFTAFIQGNHYGMVNLVYHEPLLMGMNARFRVDSYHDGVCNLSLTKTITRTSPLAMKLWNSTFFKTYPVLTDLLVRLLRNTAVNTLLMTLLNWLLPSTFKLYPFSTDPMYAQVTITADDGSGTTHATRNGNLWFSCNSPILVERQVHVTFPAK